MCIHANRFNQLALSANVLINAQQSHVLVIIFLTKFVLVMLE